MKCDEIKTVCYIDAYSTMPVYCAKEADEAIDELKQKIHDAEMSKDDAEAANTEYREDIRKLKAENDWLKDENTRLKKHNVVHIEDFINQSFKLRATNHAMCLLRAECARRKWCELYFRKRENPHLIKEMEKYESTKQYWKSKAKEYK